MTSSTRILAVAVLIGSAVALSSTDVMAWHRHCQPVRRVIAPQPSMSSAQAGAYNYGGMPTNTVACLKIR